MRGSTLGTDNLRAAVHAAASSRLNGIHLVTVVD